MATDTAALVLTVLAADGHDHENDLRTAAGARSWQGNHGGRAGEAVGAARMALSTVIVAINARLLRFQRRPA